MSWIIYGGVALFMIYMMSKGGGCCGGGHANHNGHDNSHGGHQGGHNQGHMGGAANTSIGTVQDPVCGMYVSKNDAVSRTINGRMYYFCSQDCADEFEEKHSA